MTDISTADDHRAQLLPRLADLIMALTDPEVLELASLLDALARAHGLTRKDNQ
jgi:hypothetical protein